METKAKRKCVDLANQYSEFTPSQENPDEDCFNCILDDILDTPEGETRDAWIAIYRQGLMQLNCGRTGKSYMINKEFFDKIFKG